MSLRETKTLVVSCEIMDQTERALYALWLGTNLPKRMITNDACWLTTQEIAELGRRTDAAGLRTESETDGRSYCAGPAA
jgi:hypothetical protein